MARPKKNIGIDVINHQIDTAQDEVVKAKKKYDDSTDNLKVLLDKRKALQTEELMTAIMNSKHSYEDILHYIRTDEESKESQ